MNALYPEIDGSDALLAETARMDMALARHVHACALATEDTAQVAELARAYQRITRSLRQSLALLQRLKDLRARAARLAAEESRARRNDARIGAHMVQVREGVRRVAWRETETERERFYDLFEWLDERLLVETLPDDFCDTPVDTHVLRICEEMELSPDTSAIWRRLPDVDYDIVFPDEDAEDAGDADDRDGDDEAVRRTQPAGHGAVSAAWRSAPGDPRDPA